MEYEESACGLINGFCLTEHCNEEGGVVVFGTCAPLCSVLGFRASLDHVVVYLGTHTIAASTNVSIGEPGLGCMGRRLSRPVS